MKMLAMAIFFVFLCSACVTKGKYNRVVADIQNREKQKVKLEKQLEEAQSKNELLKDSASRMGG